MKLEKKKGPCVLVGQEGGAEFRGGCMCRRRDFCARRYCGCLNSFQMGLSFLFSPHPPAWQRAPFSYFTCCDFTEPFQLVVNSSFVPGPSVNSARGSPGLTTHRNRLSKQHVWASDTASELKMDPVQGFFFSKLRWGLGERPR